MNERVQPPQQRAVTVSEAEVNQFRRDNPNARIVAWPDMGRNTYVFYVQVVDE